MRVAIPKESLPHERRVALVPDGARRLVAAKHEVVVEPGAGLGAGFDDAAYEAAGATVRDAGALYDGAGLVARVQRPSDSEADLIPEGAALVALLQPAASGPLLERLAARRVTAFALERVPRITRAQSMDVLSSQATVAGYKAVLLGAVASPKFLPMLTTAAGTIAPARALVLGAGVAGLQAIATARRLGAVVTAFDVRRAAKEQVMSLGAQFLDVPQAEDAEAAGGYAKELGEAQQARNLEAIGAALRETDLVISTALIPGRPAPRLVTRAMLAGMRRGAVLVDLAAEAGGNCEATVPGETVEVGGVTVLGPLNLPATMPRDASQMFSRNVVAVVQHLVQNDAVVVDDDEIRKGMAVVRDGRVV